MVKKIYEDLKCPKCKCMKSTIWGNDLIHTDRACIRCGFIYNRGLNKENIDKIKKLGMI